MFYYRTNEDEYKIQSTDSIDEYVLKLFNGANIINEVQVSDLNLPKNYIEQTKKSISSYTARVPLYNIRLNRIFLIQDVNIYPRIFYNNYRFVDEDFLLDLKEMSNPTEADTNNSRILLNYDFKQLKKTYNKLFYNSFVFNEYITSCPRPSSSSKMDHINPYYSISELYYLALDWDLATSSKLKDFKKLNLRSLCKDISSHDISGDILLSHQKYIYEKKSIGLVKNYSLFGSYYINQYLRKYGCCLGETKVSNPIKNPVLENQIKLMIKLIASSPPFTKSHTVYRFIESDHYIKHLSIGDIYTDPSFMSTTRNPFMYQENYNFGYVLIKIKIPKDIIGIGLCIESFSNFPNEEEIIFPPSTKLKLINITKNPEIQNIADKKLSLNKIKIKYEFELIGNNFNGDKINLKMLNDKFIPEQKILDFNQIILDEGIKSTSMSARLKYFVRYFVNTNSQFISKINNLDIIFTLQSYNSISVYKPFFYYETEYGFMMYSFHPVHGNINIMIELGPEIHVNYYFKYSITDTNLQLKLNDTSWIKWLSMLSYAVGSKSVVIHSNYSMFVNDAIDPNAVRYVHSDDVYNYLVKKERVFGKFDDDIVTPNFDYSNLDYLHVTKLFDDEDSENNILKETDNDELYEFGIKSKSITIADYYIYIVNTYPHYLSILEDKINNFYDVKGIAMNIPKSITYTLNSWTYLLNEKLITYIPKESEFNYRSDSNKSLINDKKISQFKNRLRYYLGEKVDK